MGSLIFVMTSHNEEQQLELEALESLFPNEGEFVKISENEFEMNLLPHPSKDQKNHVEIKLNVVYPPTYPDITPTWKISGCQLLSISGCPFTIARTILQFTKGSSLFFHFLFFHFQSSSLFSLSLFSLSIPFFYSLICCAFSHCA